LKGSSHWDRKWARWTLFAELQAHRGTWRRRQRPRPRHRWESSGALGNVLERGSVQRYLACLPSWRVCYEHSVTVLGALLGVESRLYWLISRRDAQHSRKHDTEKMTVASTKHFVNIAKSELLWCPFQSLQYELLSQQL